MTKYLYKSILIESVSFGLTIVKNSWEDSEIDPRTLIYIVNFIRGWRGINKHVICYSKLIEWAFVNLINVSVLLEAS